MAAITAQDLIIDPWTGLSHRAILNARQPAGNLAPSWIGTATSRHVRRLNAYKVLASYLENTSRLFLTDVTRQREHREYGDAALIVDAILAALLGDDMTTQVEHAADDRPEPPDEPAELPEGATEEARARHAAEVEEFNEAKADYDERLEVWKTATGRQEWFDEWLLAEKFPLKVHETERDAVALGDGVYLVAWSNEKRRVRLRLYDPGFYFPVESDDEDEYPDKVHLAWETVDEQGNTWVRRITLERMLLTEANRRRGADRNRRDGVEVFGDTREYPYALEGEPPSRHVTLMTDAKWKLSDLKFDPKSTGTVNTFDTSRAEYAVNAEGVQLRDYDLGIDFVPVVHVPNTVALKQHFGIAALTRVAQILDDTAAADSDLQAASAITGAPPLSIENGPGGTDLIKTYGPGTVFTGGKVTVADVSHSLTALLEYVAFLLKRLSVNARVPEEVIGRIKAGDVASGVALLLAFGPFRSLVGEMRLVRDDKYRLLFKFVQRLAIVGGVNNAEAVVPGGALTGKPVAVTLEFGSYLPNDLKGVVDMVLALLQRHAISRPAALKLLSAAGLDLGDLADELRQIETEDFEGAGALADAIGDEDAAREYLHRPPAEPEPVAVPGVPIIGPPSPPPGGPQPVPGGPPPAPAPGGPQPPR